MAQSRVVIFDTTLRDGEQAPGFSMRVDEKVRMARQLEALGVDVIEAGFPIASEDDAEAVRRISLALERTVVAALARCAAGDIDRAAWAIAPAHRGRIDTFIATSDLHLVRKLNMTRDAGLAAAVAAVTRARSYTDDVEFSAEDATRSDSDYLCRVVEAVITAGATTVNLPDTVGYSTPDEIAAFFGMVMTRVPNAGKATFSAHCHDDLGLAAANTLAAIGAGVRQVECTINGIGERAGNASLEEIVMAIRVRQDLFPVSTGVNAEQLFAASQLLTQLTGEAVQANKAIVGRNAFAHEAGIHQDGAGVTRSCGLRMWACREQRWCLANTRAGTPSLRVVSNLASRRTGNSLTASIERWSPLPTIRSTLTTPTSPRSPRGSLGCLYLRATVRE